MAIVQTGYSWTSPAKSPITTLTRTKMKSASMLHHTILSGCYTTYLHHKICQVVFQHPCPLFTIFSIHAHCSGCFWWASFLSRLLCNLKVGLAIHLVLSCCSSSSHGSCCWWYRSCSRQIGHDEVGVRQGCSFGTA